jgi:hypothetical protein
MTDDLRARLLMTERICVMFHNALTGHMRAGRFNPELAEQASQEWSEYEDNSLLRAAAETVPQEQTGQTELQGPAGGARGEADARERDAGTPQSTGTSAPLPPQERGQEPLLADMLRHDEFWDDINHDWRHAAASTIEAMRESGPRKTCNHLDCPLTGCGEVPPSAEAVPQEDWRQRDAMELYVAVANWPAIVARADGRRSLAQCVELLIEDLEKARVEAVRRAEAVVPREDRWLPIADLDVDTLALLWSPKENLYDPENIARRPELTDDMRVSTRRHWTWATHWMPLPVVPSLRVTRGEEEHG